MDCGADERSFKIALLKKSGGRLGASTGWDDFWYALLKTHCYWLMPDLFLKLYDPLVFP